MRQWRNRCAVFFLVFFYNLTNKKAGGGEAHREIILLLFSHVTDGRLVVVTLPWASENLFTTHLKRGERGRKKENLDREKQLKRLWKVKPWWLWKC